MLQALVIFRSAMEMQAAVDMSRTSSGAEMGFVLDVSHHSLSDLLL